MRVACPIKSVWAEYAAVSAGNTGCWTGNSAGELAIQEPGVVHSVDFDAPLIATHQPQRDTAFPMDPGKDEDAQHLEQ